MHRQWLALSSSTALAQGIVSKLRPRFTPRGISLLCQLSKNSSGITGRCCTPTAATTTTTAALFSSHIRTFSQGHCLPKQSPQLPQLRLPVEGHCWNASSFLSSNRVGSSVSVRGLAQAADAKKTKKTSAMLNTDASSNSNSSDSYWEQKKAAKERRRLRHVARVERIQRLPLRRVGRPRDAKKQAFQQFYIRKKVHDEYHNRKVRQISSSSKNSNNWKIRVAAIVQRIHVILPDKAEWEREYEELRAHLNLYGKVYPKELVGEMDWDHIMASRPRTDEEVLAQLLPFVPAPRVTSADVSGDVRTLDRKLQSNLYLTIQEKNESPHTNSVGSSTMDNNTNDSRRWQFPTVDLQQDETLLAAAKRAILESVGPEVEFWCPSNAPWTVDMVAFDKHETRNNNTKDGTDGADEKDGDHYYGTKTFFMLIQHDEGNVVVSPTTGVYDYAWLDRTEVVERVRQQQGDFASQFYYYML